MSILFEIQELPLLVNGKVDRQQLVRIYLESQLNLFEYSDLELSEFKLDPAQFPLARAILNGIGRTLGLTSRDGKPRLSDDFFAIGGTSINAMYAIAKINADPALDQKKISVTEFIGAEILLDLLSGPPKAEPKITIRKMRLSDKNTVVQQTAMSLHEQELLISGWDVSLESCQALSEFLFLAGQKTDFKSSLVAEIDGEVVGQIIVLDFHVDVIGAILQTNPELLEGKHAIVLSIVRDLENAVAAELLPDYPLDQVTPGIAMNPLLLTTHRTLSPAQNLAVVKAIESQVISQAKAQGYKVIVGMNTSAVTKQIADELGYKTHKIHKLNTLQDETGKLIYPIDYMWL